LKTHTQEISPLLVSVPDVLKMLSIGKSRFYEAVSSGEFGPQPVKVFGRKRLYRVSDVRLWIEKGFPNVEQFEKLKLKAKSHD